MRYFLIESGPILEKANDFRNRAAEAFAAHQTWAQSYQARRVFYGGRGLPVALDVPEKPGAGWKKCKLGFTPSSAKTAEAQAVRSEIAALPVNPARQADNDEAAQWIGWQPRTRTHIAWFGDANVIVVSNKDFLGFGGVVVPLEHLVALPVPEGCRELNEAEFDLIFQSAAA